MKPNDQQDDKPSTTPAAGGLFSQNLFSKELKTLPTQAPSIDPAIASSTTAPQHPESMT